MKQPVRVRLLIVDPQQQAQWADALRGPAFHVVSDAESSGGTSSPDVEVRDRLPAGATEDAPGEHAPNARPAVVALDASLHGDVHIGADASHSERQLVCQLLGQIVRLRRALRRDRRARHRLQHLALRDPLTGLFNRRAWQAELRRRLHANSVDTPSVILVLLDVDHFKQVNDRFGHAAGDETLRSVARMLDQGTRQSDFVARLGGDEFSILLAGIRTDGAREVVERIRTHAQTQLPDAEGRFVTLSAGYALAPPGTRIQPRSLFQAADRALRHAKQAGRNQTHE